MAVPLSPSSQSRRPARRWIGPAVLLALAAIIYGGSLSAPLVFDDWLAVTENPTLASLAEPLAILNPPQNASAVAGRPGVNLSLALDHAVYGDNPAGYRLTNVLGHVACAVLLALLLGRLLPRTLPTASPWLGWGLAALWLAHPLQTESVMSIAQRTEILSSGAILLTLYAAVRSWESPRPRGWWCLAIAGCAGGMLCKEIVVVAPLLALLLDRTCGAGGFSGAWRARRGLYLGLAGTWVLLVLLVWRMGGARGDAAGFGAGGASSWHYLLTQCEALTHYLRLVVWPQPLVLDYGMNLVTDWSSVWGSGLVLALLFLVTLWGVVRNRPWAFPAAACFLILAPSSSFMPLPAQTMAEHRMYLPSAALMVLFAGAAIRVLASWRWLLPVLVLGGTAVSWARTLDYRSEYGLWLDTVRKRPDNARAWTNLGVVCYNQGRDAEAERHLRAALTLRPDNVPAQIALGKCLKRSGQWAEAERMLRLAVAQDPASVEGLGNLALVLTQTGRAADGIGIARRAVQVAPRDPESFYYLGTVLILRQEFAAAVEPLRMAVTLHPRHIWARNNLAAALLHLGRGAEAEEHLRVVLQLQPENAEARRNLAYWLGQAAATPR